MPRKPKSKSTHYGGGQYRPAPNGRGFDCRITIRGKRHESRQPDERAARVWLDAADSDTPLTCPLTRAQMLDAQEALAKLPTGITLSKLADIYLEREAREPITTGDAVGRFLDSRERRVKPITLSGYRHTLKRLATVLPEMLADVTPKHIGSFVSQYSGVSHNSVLTNVNVFFNHAVHEGWLSSSPASRIKKVRTPEPQKGILTVNEAAALLHTAETVNPRIIPYLALGMFAGIRPGELQRISSTAITGRYIALTGSDTKTADARTITIRPNLHKWLKAYRPNGRIAHLSPRRQNKAVSELRQAAGVGGWSKDCMRHSFATYAYEHEQDLNKIAAEMGHQGTTVFFKHYRALATPGDGKRFFSIEPRLGTNWERSVKKSVK